MIELLGENKKNTIAKKMHKTFENFSKKRQKLCGTEYVSISLYILILHSNVVALKLNKF